MMLTRMKCETSKSNILRVPDDAILWRYRRCRHHGRRLENQHHPARSGHRMASLTYDTGRPQPAVSIQSREWPASEQEERSLIEAVWPHIEKANEAGPVFGRLIKELVLMPKQSKPMPKAGGKDTVQRLRSFHLYQEEIDRAYERAEKQDLLYGDVAEHEGLV